jgi:hypothetical protein
MGLQPSYLWFQASKASLLSLKGLSYQRVVLTVQEKPDYPVSETRLSGFHGFNPTGQNLPLHIFPSLLSLFSQEQL